jgi:hypothetical protein
LFASLAFATVSSVLFLLSERFDQAGDSDPATFAFAEMAMYVAVSQATSGFFQETLCFLDASLATIRSIAVTPEHQLSVQRFQIIVCSVAVVVWMFVAYVAPLWSLSRMSGTWMRCRIIYLLFYAASTALVYCATATAVRIAYLSMGVERDMLVLFAQQFLGSVLWQDPTVAQHT